MAFVLLALFLGGLLYYIGSVNTAPRTECSLHKWEYKDGYLTCRNCNYNPGKEIENDKKNNKHDD